MHCGHLNHRTTPSLLVLFLMGVAVARWQVLPPAAAQDGALEHFAAMTDEQFLSLGNEYISLAGAKTHTITRGRNAIPTAFLPLGIESLVIYDSSMLAVAVATKKHATVMRLLEIITGENAQNTVVLSNVLIRTTRDQNEENLVGLTLLQLAVLTKDLRMVELILDKKVCDVNSPNLGDGFDAVLLSVKYGTLATTKRICKEKALELDPLVRKQFRGDEGNHPIHLAAIQNDKDTIVFLVQEKGVSVDTQKFVRWAESPLFLAIENNHIGLAKMLVEELNASLIITSMGRDRAHTTVLGQAKKFKRKVLHAYLVEKIRERSQQDQFNDTEFDCLECLDQASGGKEDL